MSRGRLLPPLLRRFVKRAGVRAARAARPPFSRLVRHFLTRLVRGDDSISGDFQPGAGALLGLLAVPGAFQCFLLLDKYSTLLDWLRGRRRFDLLVTSAPDKYLFLSLAMAVTGIVTVLKWDRILPDGQDYANLAPLPIRRRAILLANATAIAIAVLVVSLDVNAIPAVMFPFFVTASSSSPSWSISGFIAAHTLSVVLASVFAFSAVFGLLGLGAAVLPRETFRSLSPWLRGLVLVAFVMLLFGGFAGPAFIRQLAANPESPARLLPPMWFLGLYQTLQHRASPSLAVIAPRAIWATAIAIAAAMFLYGFTYRRRFAAILEGVGKPASKRLLPGALSFLDLFSFGDAFARATYRFTIRTLLRSEAHRVLLAVALGLGWILALQVPLLEAAFIPAYLLVLGLRIAFEIPAAAPANWIFQTAIDARAQRTLFMARQTMLALLSLFVLLPTFGMTWWSAGFIAALLHTLYVFALALCLIEILLAGYRKIPFTCLMPGFRDNLPVMCFAQLLGFAAFTHIGAAVEAWLMAHPLRFLLLPAGMWAIWFWNEKRLKEAAEAGELEIGLSFDNRLRPAVERLNLFDSD